MLVCRKPRKKKVAIVANKSCVHGLHVHVRTHAPTRALTELWVYSDFRFLYKIQILIQNSSLWDLTLFRKAFSLNKIKVYAVPILRGNRMNAHH